MAGVEQTAETKRMLKDLGIPVIQFMDLDPDPIDHVVGFSHVAAARAGVEHMLDQGFQNIGYLSAQMDPRAQKRCACPDLQFKTEIDHWEIMESLWFPNHNQMIFGTDRCFSKVPSDRKHLFRSENAK